MSLRKLADKFANKYAQTTNDAANMAKIVGALDKFYRLNLYLQALPNVDYSVVRDGQTGARNFSTYLQGIEENIAPYYNPDTRQYTQLYKTQKRLPSSTVALLKKQLLEATPYAYIVNSVIWFNTNDPSIREATARLAMDGGRLADQIVL